MFTKDDPCETTQGSTLVSKRSNYLVVQKWRVNQRSCRKHVLSTKGQTYLEIHQWNLVWRATCHNTNPWKICLILFLSFVICFCFCFVLFFRKPCLSFNKLVERKVTNLKRNFKLKMERKKIKQRQINVKEMKTKNKQQTKTNQRWNDK